jgi:hypothetical protein
LCIGRTEDGGQREYSKRQETAHAILQKSGCRTLSLHNAVAQLLVHSHSVAISPYHPLSRAGLELVRRSTIGSPDSGTTWGWRIVTRRRSWRIVGRRRHIQRVWTIGIIRITAGAVHTPRHEQYRTKHQLPHAFLPVGSRATLAAREHATQPSCSTRAWP